MIYVAGAYGRLTARNYNNNEESRLRNIVRQLQYLPVKYMTRLGHITQREEPPGLPLRPRFRVSLQELFQNSAGKSQIGRRLVIFDRKTNLKKQRHCCEYAVSRRGVHHDLPLTGGSHCLKGVARRVISS